MSNSRRALPRPARLAVEALEDRKGVDTTVLDLRGITNTTDFFLIASGTSRAHVRGLSDAVIEKLEADDVQAHHLEGVTGGRWVLIDYLDFVVHLFHPEARAFYQLERLWSDAPVVLGAMAAQEKGRSS